RSNVKESDVRSNAYAIDLVSSASQGNRRYSRLPAARRSKRTVSAYPECIQVSTWLLCKVTSGYGAGTKKNAKSQYVVTVPVTVPGLRRMSKSVLGYGAGYGAGTRRMYTSQYVVTVPVTVPGLEECIQVSTWLLCRLRCGTKKNVYKSVRGYGAGNKKNVYKSVRGYGAGYGAGTKKNVYKSVRGYGAGTKKNVYKS